jgi:hypothetical protein
MEQNVAADNFLLDCFFKELCDDDIWLESKHNEILWYNLFNEGW